MTSQMSECSNLMWSSALTPESTSQPNPSQNIPVSPWVDINTPSQASMDMPPPPATPVPKRKALSVVSGNRRQNMRGGEDLRSKAISLSAVLRI